MIGDADDRVTLMGSLLKAVNLEYRIVFKDGTCWIEVPEAAMSSGWMKIESIHALVRYIEKYGR